MKNVSYAVLDLHLILSLCCGFHGMHIQYSICIQLERNWNSRNSSRQFWNTLENSEQSLVCALGMSSENFLPLDRILQVNCCLLFLVSLPDTILVCVSFQSNVIQSMQTSNTITSTHVWSSSLVENCWNRTNKYTESLNVLIDESYSLSLRWDSRVSWNQNTHVSTSSFYA